MHSTHTETLVIRALEADDAADARALMLVAWDHGHPEMEQLLARLDRAARQESGEALGLAAVIEDELVGVMLFGMTAGAIGTAALHGAIVRDDVQRRGVGSALMRGVVKLLDAEHARLLVAEVPESDSMEDYRAFLAHSGFTEEARIPDFVKDDVALGIWRRELEARLQ